MVFAHRAATRRSSPSQCPVSHGLAGAGAQPQADAADRTYADHVWYLRVLTLSDAGVRDVVAQGNRSVLAAIAIADGDAAAQAMRGIGGGEARYGKQSD